jgi:hypothetical protein
MKLCGFLGSIALVVRTAALRRARKWLRGRRFHFGFGNDGTTTGACAGSQGGQRKVDERQT